MERGNSGEYKRDRYPDKNLPSDEDNNSSEFATGERHSDNTYRSFEDQHHHKIDQPYKDADDQNAGNNLFITGLAPETKEGDLENVFSKYGKIEKVSIMLDPHTLISRGFAFITFADIPDAETALNECSRGLEIHGKSLIVDRARRSRARAPTPGVYRGPPKRDLRRPRDYHGGSIPRSGLLKSGRWQQYREKRHYDSRRQHYQEIGDEDKYESRHRDYKGMRGMRERSPY